MANTKSWVTLAFSRASVSSMETTAQKRRGTCRGSALGPGQPSERLIRRRKKERDEQRRGETTGQGREKVLICILLQVGR